MTVPELQWLIGIAVTVISAIGGIAYTAFRSVSTKLDKAVGEMAKAVKDGDDNLHERLNRVRDDIGNNYVRRVDLDSHMKRVDETLKEMRDDQKEIIRSLAALEGRQERRRE